MNRRQLFSTVLTGAVSAVLFSRGVWAQDADLFDLKADDGGPITNFKVPAELSLYSLPGMVAAGSATPDVILVEFFDYNCPFCRKAVTELDTLLAGDSDLQLKLVNNPIISPQSAAAATVQQGVLKLFGPVQAYRFHKAMFARRGVNDGPAALQTVAALGLDADGVRKAAGEPNVAAVLGRQIELAKDLDFLATPSFVLNSVGMLGYPGARNIGDMVSALRKCGKPVC